MGVEWETAFTFDDVIFEHHYSRTGTKQIERARWHPEEGGFAQLARHRMREDGEWGPWKPGVLVSLRWTVEIPRAALLILTDLTLDEIRRKLIALSIQPALTWELQLEVRNVRTG